jgi:hypothetical protein
MIIRFIREMIDEWRREQFIKIVRKEILEKEMKKANAQEQGEITNEQ